MDLYAGHPVWITGAGPALGRPLVRDAECDVVVVGAGVTGTLAADALLDRGLRVVVLDKDGPACGSTAASTALLMYELDVPLHQLAGMIGIRRAQRGFKLGMEAIDRIEALCAQLPECGFRRCQSLYFTKSQDGVPALRKELEARQAADFAVTWLEQRELRQQFGMEAAAALASAVGAQVDPYRFTRRLLERCQERGAEVFGEALVTSLEADSSGVRVLTAGGRAVRASHAVVATGYEAQVYVRLPDAQLSSTYVVSCRVHDPPRRQPIAWEFASPYLYSRWMESGRLLVGGQDEEFTDPRARNRLLPRKVAQLMTRARALYPGIELKRDAAWTGTFGSTRDGLGFVGAATGQPRVLFVLGFGGNGITLSAAGAAIVADCVMGRNHPDAALFALNR